MYLKVRRLSFIFNPLEHTARLLNDLARQESLKGFSLPKTENLSPKQDEFLKFLQRIQEINPGVALLMATQFKTFRELLNRFEICSSTFTHVKRHKTVHSCLAACLLSVGSCSHSPLLLLWKIIEKCFLFFFTVPLRRSLNAAKSQPTKPGILYKLFVFVVNPRGFTRKIPCLVSSIHFPHCLAVFFLQEHHYILLVK